MAEGLFLHSYNENSKRFAILDEQGDVAFLYLSEIGKQRPERDSVAYMLTEPQKGIDWQLLANEGLPPQISKELASKSAVISLTKESDLSFHWSNDGHAVALLYKKDPITFVTINDKLGYSKAVIKDIGLANAWNQAKYESIFK
ncbi:hypothetical protein [Bacterioplanoides sp.]|uniref:hypothetical protein n=1 Tax=Bacterioplanoides sp. TaxID=2066072 RepID=UPI003B5AB439